MLDLLPIAQPLYEAIVAACDGADKASSRAAHLASWYAVYRPGAAPTNMDRDAYTAHRLAQGASIGTVNNEWHILRRYLKAVTDGTPAQQANASATDPRAFFGRFVQHVDALEKAMRQMRWPPAYELGNPHPVCVTRFHAGALIRAVGQLLALKDNPDVLQLMAENDYGAGHQVYGVYAPYELWKVISGASEERGTRVQLLYAIVMSGVGLDGAAHFPKDFEDDTNARQALIDERAHIREKWGIGRKLEADLAAGRFKGGLYLDQDLWETVQPYAAHDGLWGRVEWHRFLWLFRGCVGRAIVTDETTAENVMGDTVTAIAFVETLANSADNFGQADVDRYVAGLTAAARAHYALCFPPENT